MGEEDKALEYHQMDMQIAEQTGNVLALCRAYGNLGVCHESLGDYDRAISFQEQHLSTAARSDNTAGRTLAFTSLGRVHHAMGNYLQANQYLQQALQLAESSGQLQDEAKIRHQLGLSLLAHSDLEEARLQLQRAVELFENIRREAQYNSDFKLSLFDLQTASYQALQRVLVGLGRHDEALVVAERSHNRAFVDLLLERQHTGGDDWGNSQGAEDDWQNSLDCTPITKEQIVEIVSRQKAAVMYYSVAAGFLYSWLILPQQGVVKFHESSVHEFEASSEPEDTQSMRSFRSLNVSTASLLDVYVGQARESLGIESHLSSSRLSLSKSSFNMSETESDAEDLWQQHLEEIGDRLNAENDRTGFLRMVNRNQVHNASSYSMSSMWSYPGSTTSGVFGNRMGSVRSRVSMASNSSGSKPPLKALYDLLIGPMDEILTKSNTNLPSKDLVLILQGDLYLVPFALLKEKQAVPALFERFNLLVMPSIHALQASHSKSGCMRYNPECSGALVVGSPRIPQAVTDQWQWGALPGAEQECKMVAEIMGNHAVTGPQATKDNVLHQMVSAEVIHLATHVSWKLSALVLSPGDFSTTRSVQGNMECMDLNDSSDNLDASFQGPPLHEFLLTAADILNIKLSAKLVVISSGHTDDRAGRINSDGVVGLTRALLAAGAQCVLFCLWPVPEMAGRILLKAFYTAMLQGTKASHALSQGMTTVQNTRQFIHPSNWAGWVLVGSDVRLSSKVALMGHALCELLHTPGHSREAMRVCLHLVEKSLQRIRNGQHSAMYTTQQSIENRVGGVGGWRDLLLSVGFRFEQDTNGLPASVFFPTSDPGDRLTQCSASLQALLGLPLPTLQALAKTLEQPEAGEALSTLVREAHAQLGQDGGIQLAVAVRLWRVAGVHEFLASLGFDLVEVGKDDVTIKAGKQANRRALQFAVQALVAVFDTLEAPRTLLLDSSSSMESLASSSSATDTSNFSKGSSPPTSPTSRKRSYFNPAEVVRMPTAAVGKGHQGVKGRGSSHHSPLSSLSLHLSHQDAIRRKYSSPSASDASDTNTADDMPRVIAIETTDDDVGHLAHGARGFGNRQSLFDRVGGTKEFFPRPQYSTSASDSEDAHIPENNLIRALSQSRTSLASQSSTLTAKSTGSGGGFRRTRARSSVASTRSSASDRTITNDSRSASLENMLDGEESKPEEFLLSRNSMESLASNRSTDSRAKRDMHHKKNDVKHKKAVFEKSAMSSAIKDSSSLKTGGERKSVWKDRKCAHPVESDTSTTSGEHVVRRVVTTSYTIDLDPTAVAHRVLMETKQERRALEQMQRWTAHNMDQELAGKRAEVLESVMNAAEKKQDVAISDASTAVVSSSPMVATPASSTGNTTITSAVIHKPPPALPPPRKAHSSTGPPVKPKPILVNALPPRQHIPEPELLQPMVLFPQPAEGTVFSEPPLRVLDFDENASMLSAINEESEVSYGIMNSDTDGEVLASLQTPPKRTPVSANKSKSVSFQEEVEMCELYSSMENVNSETGTSRLGDTETAPRKEHRGDDVDTGEIISNSNVRHVSEVPFLPSSNTDSSSASSVGRSQESSVSNKSKQMTPTGYRVPPLNPVSGASRRQSSLDSTASSDQSIPGTTPSMESASSVQRGVVNGLKNRQVFSTESAGSASEHDSWDFNSPQRLQKASMQFYKKSPQGPASNSTFKQRYLQTISQGEELGAAPANNSNMHGVKLRTALPHHTGNTPITSAMSESCRVPRSISYTARTSHLSPLGPSNVRGSYSDGSVHSTSGSDTHRELPSAEDSSEREWYQSDSEDQDNNVHSKLDSSWTSLDSDIVRMEQNLRRTHVSQGNDAPPAAPHSNQDLPNPAVAVYQSRDSQPANQIASANQNIVPDTQPSNQSTPVSNMYNKVTGSGMYGASTANRNAASTSRYEEDILTKESKVLYKGVVMYTSDC